MKQSQQSQLMDRLLDVDLGPALERDTPEQVPIRDAARKRVLAAVREAKGDMFEIGRILGKSQRSAQRYCSATPGALALAAQLRAERAHGTIRDPHETRR